jgi:hypothetical protein
MEKKERSEAQKAADKRYYEQNKEKFKANAIHITLKKGEPEKLTAAIKNAGMTQPEFIRKAYELIFSEKL